MPLREVSFDFVDVRGANPEVIEGILVSAGLPLLDAHLAQLRGAGLIPVVVDVEVLALGNARLSQASSTQDPCVVLVDVGCTQALLHVVQAGRSLLTRHVAIGPSDTNLLGLCGAIQQTCTAVVDSRKLRPNRVDLCGGGSLRPEVVHRLQESLPAQMTVGLWNPLESVASAVDRARPDGPPGAQFAIALGLASRVADGLA